jgi:hypothetical protein
MARVRPCTCLPHLPQAKATVGEAAADPLTATQGVCVSQLDACRKGIAGGSCRLAAVAVLEWCLCPDVQLSHMVSDPCMGDTTIPACGTAPCRTRERTRSTVRTLE